MKQQVMYGSGKPSTGVVKSSRSRASLMSRVAAIDSSHVLYFLSKVLNLKKPLSKKAIAYLVPSAFCSTSFILM